MNYEQSDKLHIRDLLIQTTIGTHAREREKKRDVILNLTLYTETAEAMKEDDIELAVDYEILCNKLISYVQNSSFALIETLAEAISDLLLSTRGILACKVVLDKFDALDSCKSVAVEIFRESSS